MNEALQDGNSILSYFNSPLDGSRGSTGTHVNISGETNPADVSESSILFA